MEDHDTSNFGFRCNVCHNVGLLGRLGLLRDTEICCSDNHCGIHSAYYLLKAEDEVDDGLSEFRIGLNIEDKPSLVAMLIVVLMGVWYSFMSIVMPGERIAPSVWGGKSGNARCGPGSSF